MDAGQVAAILLTALLTLVVTIAGQRFLEKKAGLRYRIHSSGDLVPANAKVPLDISYGGAPVDHLVQLQVEFINTGNVPIQKDAHAVRISWKVPKGELIEHVADGEKIEMTSYTDEDAEHIVADLVLLNPHETSTMEFLIAGEANPTIDITARGVGVVGRLDSPSRLRPTPAFIGIGAGFVVSLIFGLALFEQIELMIRGFGIAGVFLLSLGAITIYSACMAVAISYFDRRR